MVASTAGRVVENTAPEVNQQICGRTREHVAQTAAGGPAAIAARLAALDREWDVERVLELMAGSFSLTGVVLGATVSRKWLLVPTVVLGFFLQHTVQGWCPPLPVLRRLGLRTADEIARERYALKALRGDFRDIEPVEAPSSARFDAAVAAVIR